MKLSKTQAVYVIYNPDFNITKIGVSDNVQKRKESLQFASGCELITFYQSDHLFNAHLYEAMAHTELSHKRGIGEWFSVPPEEATDVVKRVIKDADVVADKIVLKYRQGVTITDIAQEHGVSRQAIIARLKHYGIKDDDYVKQSTNIKTWRILGIMNEPPKVEIITNPNKEEFIPISKEQPSLPLQKLKRFEPNINYNGEWYQTSIYKNGEFSHFYTRDVEEARRYVQHQKV